MSQLSFAEVGATKGTYTPPVDLYCFFEISIWAFISNWNKKSISKLIFAGYTGSKISVWNRLNIQFVKLDFSKLIFQKSSTDQQGELGEIQWMNFYSLHSFWYYVHHYAKIWVFPLQPKPQGKMQFFAQCHKD